MKHIIIVLIIGILTLVPFEICYVVNPVFVSSVTSLSVNNLLYISLFIFVLFIIAIFVGAFLSKNVPSNGNILPSLPISLVTTTIGVLAICSGGAAIMSVLLTSLSLLNLFKLTFLSIFSILAGITFIVTSICFFSGKNMFKRVPLICLIPSIWFIIRISRFLIQHVVTPINVLYICMIFEYIFMLLFIFNNAKQFVFLQDKGVVKNIFMFGAPAILFSLIYNLSIIYFKFSGIPDYTTGYSIECIIDLLISLYILLDMIYILKNEKYNRVVPEIDEERDKELDRLVEEVYSQLDDDFMNNI